MIDRHQPPFCSVDLEIPWWMAPRLKWTLRKATSRRLFGALVIKSKMYKCEPFDAKIFPTVNTILNDYVKGDIDDDSARIKLLQLCAQLNDDERHVIQAIVGLIPSLYDCNMKTISESHLSSSYIHPFIHGLFSSKTPSKVAHCSNLMVDEQEDSNKRRPGYKVDVYVSYEYAYTTAYGEIEASKNASPVDKVMDFHRLAIFCKDSMDKYNLDSTLGIQVVGQTITFFAMDLQYEQLYTFTEIASMEVSLKKSNLLNLVGRFNDMKMLSSIHTNLCKPSDRDAGGHFSVLLPL